MKCPCFCPNLSDLVSYFEGVGGGNPIDLDLIREA
jgi:hypothetical protein